MLFSPMQREMRNPPFPSTPPSPLDDVPRRRVQSTPKALPSAPVRWAAPTPCDMLVFPKPRITPHTITPPASPPTSDADVLEMGQLRLREREDWARASQSKQRGRSRSRGRSFSLSHRTEPPPDAPIIGSAVARREEAEQRERRRSSSASRPHFGRLRSSSFGTLLSRGNSTSRPSTERPSFIRRGSSDQSSRPSGRGLSGCVGGSRSVVDLGVHRQPRGHTYTHSSPDLLSRDRSDRSQPLRTVRVRSPVRRGEVVIINNISEPIDFSKPLPPTPVLDDQSIVDLPSASSPKKRNRDIGVAISNPPSEEAHPNPTPLSIAVLEATPIWASARSPTKPLSEQNPASARAQLAKQHQRAKTRRAFAAPASGPSRPRSGQSADFASPSSAAPLSASRISAHSIYSTADRASVVTPTPLHRKPTAMEEAISRSRAASLSNPEPSSRPHSRGRPRTAEESDSARTSLALDPIRRAISPPLAYPITTIPSPRFDVESFAQQQNHSLLSAVERPKFSHTDTGASAMSGRTVYTDASEGWDRVGAVTPEARASPGDTASPEASPEDEREFKVCLSPSMQISADLQGLFFRTPQDRAGEFAPKRVLAFKPKPTSVAFPSALLNETSVGLGYDLPPVGSSGLKRDSSGAFSTADSVIATPTIIPDPEAGGSQTQPRGISPSSSRGHLRQVNLGQRRPPSLQENPEYGLPSRTDIDATSGKRRASVPDASYFRNSKALSPTTFGVHSPSHLDEPTQLDLPTSRADESQRPPYQRFSQITDSSPLLSIGSPYDDRRNSAAVSFINDFPTPPSTQSDEMNQLEIPPGQHASAFGQLVTGPPGAGKTTYCNGMHQFLTALKRPVHIVNLDPAVPNPPYPCAINISEIVTLDEAMTEHGLGPNGAMLYCVEYLEKNFDWLVERLDEVLKDGGGYVIFDTPGQVELWTNHDSLKRIVERLMKMEYRLAAVHLSDAHYITDGSKFISVVLLALRAMMQLEMPHINVLSKIDLLSTYGQLPFDLKYYTEARELGYLLNSLDSGPRSQKMEKLNRAMVELVEEYGLVGFETLAVEDKQSMLQLLRQIDKATGYIFVPPPSAGGGSSDLLDNAYALFSTGAGDIPGWDVNDVEERWGERKGEWDEVEREKWKREHEMRRAGEGGA